MIDTKKIRDLSSVCQTWGSKTFNYTLRKLGLVLPVHWNPKNSPDTNLSKMVLHIQAYLQNYRKIEDRDDQITTKIVKVRVPSLTINQVSLPVMLQHAGHSEYFYFYNLHGFDLESSSLTWTNVEELKVLHPHTKFGGYCRCFSYCVH